MDKEEFYRLDFGAIITKTKRPCSNARNTDCLYIKQCLDVAVKKKWPGFSCEECELKDSKPRVAELTDSEYGGSTKHPVHCDFPKKET